MDFFLLFEFTLSSVCKSCSKAYVNSAKDDAKEGFDIVVFNPLNFFATPILTLSDPNLFVILLIIFADLDPLPVNIIFLSTK